MLISISLLMVAVYTTYFILTFSYSSARITSMTGMIVAMAVGMTSSLTIGLILGIVFEHNLIKSTIFAILLSLIVGYCAGKSSSLLAAIEGMSAGLMGGMMGAMLGAMLPSGQFTMMLAFMDVLYIIVVSLLLLLLNKELHDKSEIPVPFLHTHIPSIIMIVLTIIICTVAYYDGIHIKQPTNNTPIEPQLHEHTH